MLVALQEDLGALHHIQRETVPLAQLGGEGGWLQRRDVHLAAERLLRRR
jgi:hypothetical protein